MSKYEDLWKVMLENTFETDEDCINNGLTCVICKNLIIDAYQSECGCQYCYKCIKNYLEREEDKFCPGIKIDCKKELLVLEENVKGCPYINKKTSELIVKCPNQSCMCKIELTKMEEHLRVCTNQPLTGSNITTTCEDELEPKDSVLTHLRDETFTNTKLLNGDIQNIKNEFGILKGKFETSKLEISSLKEASRMKEIQIIEQIELFKEESRNKEREIKEENEVEILFMKEESKLKEMQIKEIIEQIEFIKEDSKNKEMKMKEEREFEISYLREESIMKEIQIMKQIKELKTENTNMTKTSKMKDMEMKEIIENLNKDIKLLKEVLKEMKEEQRIEIPELANKETIKYEKGKKEGENNEEVKKRREDNSLKLFPNIDVDFIWKIDEFTKKRQINGQHYFSQPFYSNDYNLCLSAMFIEDNFHLSIWIMKGDYDDKVKWPLNKALIVGIVDQESWTVFKSIKQKYNKDIYTKAGFYKPIYERNDIDIYFSNDNYRGHFIKYSLLMKEGQSCLMNDCLLVFCLLSDN